MALIVLRCSGCEDEPGFRHDSFDHRSRVVSTLPGEAAVIRLVESVRADMHDELQAGARRNLPDTSMPELYPERDTGAIAGLKSGELTRRSSSKSSAPLDTAMVRDPSYTSLVVRHRDNVSRARDPQTGMPRDHPGGTLDHDLHSIL